MLKKTVLGAEGANLFFCVSDFIPIQEDNSAHQMKR